MYKCVKAVFLATSFIMMGVLASAGASAEEMLLAEADESGYYFGLGLGRTEAKEYCDLKGGGYLLDTTSCNSPVSSFRGMLGYQSENSLAVEARYVRTGRIENTYANSFFVSGYGGGTLSAVQFVFVASLPEKHGFSAFGEVGGASWSFSSSGASTGFFGPTEVAYSQNSQGNSIMYGFGAKYRLDRGLLIRVGYESFKAGALDVYWGRGLGRVSMVNADILYKF